MALRFRGLDAPVEVRYWKGGSAPVPDPQAQAAAEAGANRYNVVSPSGSTTWQQGDRIIEGYDRNNNPIYGTQATQTVQLSPTEQRQYDIQNQIAETMLGGAQGRVPQFADSNFSFDQATPAAATAAYQRQVNLLQPQFKMMDSQFEDRMQNAGIPVGSDAYNEALRQHENDKNFALTDAASGAEQEGSQMALTQRQENYNEIANALGGSQLAPVTAYGGGNASPLDISGAYSQMNQANLANYNSGVASQNANIGAGSAVAAAAIIAF